MLTLKHFTIGVEAAGVQEKSSYCKQRLEMLFLKLKKEREDKDQCCPLVGTLNEDALCVLSSP